GADGVVAQSHAATIRNLASERPPRLRRFGSSRLFLNGADTPPSQGGEYCDPHCIYSFTPKSRDFHASPPSGEYFFHSFEHFFLNRLVFDLDRRRKLGQQFLLFARQFRWNSDVDRNVKIASS